MRFAREVMGDMRRDEPARRSGTVPRHGAARFVRGLFILGAFLWMGAACKDVEPGRALTGAVGARCTVPEDCELVAAEADDDEAPVCLKMPGGYCSLPCDGDTWDCDDQAICEALGDQVFYCLDGCLTANGSHDCRTDYRCSPRTDVRNRDGSEVGVCLPRCETDFDCEAGRRCQQQTGDCLPRGDRAAGAACTLDDVCNGGLCLEGIAFRGGYCSARCGRQFAECEDGSVCSTLGAEALCLRSCDVDDDCRAAEEYICRQVTSRRDQAGMVRAVKVCVPRCQSNAACDDGHHCDLATGDCQVGVGRPNPDGAFCDADADCESGVCLSGESFPNGYCSRPCEADADCGPGHCREGECFTACAGPLDCRGGYVCDTGACLPRCTNNGDCVDGTVCSLSLGTCVRPAADGTWLEEIVLTENIIVSGVPSDTLSLEVPSDALSVAIMADGSGGDLMVIAEMTDPSGRRVFDYQNTFGSEMRFFPGRGHITQLIPTSPRTAPLPGPYRFKLIKEGDEARLRVRALVKRGQGEPTAGTMDINLFFADLGDLDAASAPTDPAIRTALDTLRSVYARRDLRIGEVHYCDLPAEERERFAVIDTIKGPASELSRMFTLSGQAEALGCTGGPALNFFMVQEVIGGRVGFVLLGHAGGIPGPAIHGTSQSGVAVTTINLRLKPRQLGLTMAHEGGHYLGLFHTTEAEGMAFDPLPDTPECGPDEDVDADGVVSYDECLDADAANLMFWSAGRAASQLSGDQGFILLRNPAVK